MKKKLPVIVPISIPKISSKDNDSTWSLVMLTTGRNFPMPLLPPGPRQDWTNNTLKAWRFLFALPKYASSSPTVKSLGSFGSRSWMLLLPCMAKSNTLLCDCCKLKSLDWNFPGGAQDYPLVQVAGLCCFTEVLWFILPSQIHPSPVVCK